MLLLRNETGLVAPTHRALEPFRLYRPTTVEEALSAQRDEGSRAVWACGTTDLVARVREGLVPEAVISTRRVAEMAEVYVDGDGLVIGAGVDHQQGARHPDVGRVLAGFAQGWARIANPRIRLRASVGGNLMARRARYELSAMFDALGARLVFRTAAEQSEVGPEAVWDGSVPSGSLLTHVVVPDTPSVRFAYDRSLRPVLTVALAVRWHEGGLVVRAVTGSEYRPPAGAELETTPDQIGAAAHALAEQLPASIGDQAASAAYRRRAVAALVRRHLPRLVQDAA